jgi:hypothetical protein
MHLLSLEQVLKGGGCVEDHRSRKGQQAKGARGALESHGSDKRHSAIAGVGGRDYLYRIVAHGTLDTPKHLWVVSSLLSCLGVF